jgi:hypothetical protein
MIVVCLFGICCYSDATIIKDLTNEDSEWTDSTATTFNLLTWPDNHISVNYVQLQHQILSESIRQMVVKSGMELPS